MKSYMLGLWAGPAASLTFAFVILRLGGLIDWPWVWIVSPAWLFLSAAAGDLAWFVLVKAPLQRWAARELKRRRLEDD